MLLKTWKRSICESISYPEFLSYKAITLPDQLAAEEPDFSGIVRYETSFSVDGFRRLLLEIEDAAEGVEVFINGQSVGIQISPPFLYEITAQAQVGVNNLAIEVATTLERKCHAMGVRPLLDAEYKVPSSCSGITGNVTLWIDSENTTQISS